SRLRRAACDDHALIDEFAHHLPGPALRALQQPVPQVFRQSVLAIEVDEERLVLVAFGGELIAQYHELRAIDRDRERPVSTQALQIFLHPPLRARPEIGCPGPTLEDRSPR